jgi:hypothetical protein
MPRVKIDQTSPEYQYLLAMAVSSDRNRASPATSAVRASPATSAVRASPATSAVRASPATSAVPADTFDKWQLENDLDLIGWSDREFSRRIGCDKKAVHRYRVGEAKPAPEVLAWLAKVATWMKNHPAPKDWKRR